MNFLRSSIGQKILMAVTGFILVVFVIGHLIGNLQVFSHPDHINGYAHFLQSLGPTLWIARILLLIAVLVHIWVATVLTLENRAARQVPYRFKHTVRATLASRTMRWTGVVVLAFILYHLAHFTIGWAQPGTFKENLPPYTMTADYHVAGIPVVAAGTQVLDVHTMVIRGFQSPVVGVFYIIAIGLLSFHLLHGFQSMFQSLGLRSAKSARALQVITVLFCLAYFLGNLAIPGAVLLGKLQPRPAAVASR